MDLLLCYGCSKGGGLVALVPINWLLQGVTELLQLEICSSNHHLSVSKREMEGCILTGVPWNQQPSRTGCFFPQGCQETVPWAVLLWWRTKESKHPFSLLLSKRCSQHFKGFQKCLGIILQSHPLQHGENQGLVGTSYLGAVNVCLLLKRRRYVYLLMLLP